jgi:hypothetical protein
MATSDCTSLRVSWCVSVELPKSSLPSGDAAQVELVPPYGHGKLAAQDFVKVGLIPQPRVVGPDALIGVGLGNRPIENDGLDEGCNVAHTYSPFVGVLELQMDVFAGRKTLEVEVARWDSAVDLGVYEVIPYRLTALDEVPVGGYPVAVVRIPRPGDDPPRLAVSGFSADFPQVFLPLLTPQRFVDAG